MAIHALYDYGYTGITVPTWGGSLISFTSTINNIAYVQYDATTSGNPVTAGDVGIIRRNDYPSEFFVFYVVSAIPVPGEPGTFPIRLTVSFDSNIYSITPSPVTNYSVQVYSKNYYSTYLEDFASVLSFKSSIEKAHYSNQLIAYSRKISHKVEVNDLRRNFYPNSKSLLLANSIFLINTCFDGVTAAYKVAADDSTFDIFNNKYKKSISFTVAV